MKNFSRMCLALLMILSLTAGSGFSWGQETATKPSSESEKLNAKLSKYLSGTKWIGNFTMGTGKMRTERYEILSATKGETGDAWNLIARIKYGDKDMTFPLPPIDIKFAGKTPVITVDRVFFPGFGTFDARVVIRRGKYAGTWQHDKVGGHMFGTIEKMTPEELVESQKRVKELNLDSSDTPEAKSDGGKLEK